MNNIKERNPYISGYPGVFTCMGFDKREMCIHTFDTHVLLYVYSGTLELFDGNTAEYVPRGACAFVHKGETLRLVVIPDDDDESHIMKMILPHAFLCELYHCEYCGNDGTSGNMDYQIEHLLAPNAATASLFQSLVPFYDAGTDIPKNLYRLKLTEAVLVLLAHNPGTRRHLFDFAYTPMDLLDVVKTTDPKPMYWKKSKQGNRDGIN